jgi:hypothetical protein
MYYASYTKYKRLCPHCGEHFQTLLDPTALRLGPNVRTCHKCRRAFSSGSLEWPELTPAQKRKFLFGGLPWFLAFFGLFAAFPFYMGIKEPNSSGVDIEIAGAVLGVAACLLAAFYLICGVQIIFSKRRYAREKEGLDV